MTLYERINEWVNDFSQGISSLGNYIYQQISDGTASLRDHLLRKVNSYVFQGNHTPLSFYAQEGDLGGVEQGIYLGYDVDEADQAGFTPLARAAKHNEIACTKALLEAGADIGKECHGLSPLEIALRNGSWETAVYLIKQGAKNNPHNNRHALYYAIEHNLDDLLSTTLDNIETIDICQSDAYEIHPHPLSVAAKLNRRDCFKSLVESHKYDVVYLQQALFVAIEEGNHDIINMITTKLDNFEFPRADTLETPLLLSARLGNLVLVNLFLLDRPDLTLKGTDQQTVIDLLANHQQVYQADAMKRIESTLTMVLRREILVICRETENQLAQQHAGSLFTSAKEIKVEDKIKAYTEAAHKQLVEKYVTTDKGSAFLKGLLNNHMTELLAPHLTNTVSSKFKGSVKAVIFSNKGSVTPSAHLLKKEPRRLQQLSQSSRNLLQI